MVKEGIVLGHKVSGAGLEVDKAKIDVISKLPPTSMDKSQITRKQSKSSKHGHENQKSSKRSQRIKAKPQSKSIKPQSNPVKDGQ
ncbi:hypothetical protein Tco_0074977 [Tanacetum coccineum]